MKKKLLTKTFALMLLAVFATAWSTQAWAGVTINVKSNQNIYLYAWDDDENPIFGSWPGTQMTFTTDIKGETWFTKTFPGYEKVNFILSLGGETADDTKTGTLSSDPNNKGVKNGSVYYEYDPQKYGNDKVNNLTDLYDIPVGVTYEANNVTVYYVNTNNWNKPYVYISNGNSGMGNQNNEWPGDLMTKVGTNSNGWDVYKWSNNYPNNPNLVIFSNNGANQTGNIPYTQNGYYSGANTSNYITTIGTERDGTVIYNTPAYFYDANMRAAIQDALRVPASSTNVTDPIYAIVTKSVRVLDVSNHNISNLGSNSAGNTNGVGYFTELEELYAGSNSINHGNLTALTKMRILDMHGNSGLKGFGVNSATDSNPILNIPPAGSNSMEYVDLSNCAIIYMAALADRASENLNTLILANNTSLCSSSALDLTNYTNLKYLDLSNTGLNEARAKTTLNTTALSNLETLKVNNNMSMASAYTGTLSSLKHFEIADGDLYFTAAHQLASLTPDNNPNLEYLDISNAKISSSANPIDGFQNLKTVISGNNPQMPKLTINNCPAIETIDISNNTSETILSITNSNLDALPTITDLSTTPALTKIDLTGNAFTIVPEVGGNINILVMNSNLLTDIVAPSNIKYLYAQNNKFPAGEYTLPQTSLVGLDLGNNGFTKFKAENNTSLKSLALAGPNNRNSALTEIELHGNTALTQTSPDGVIESDNGLYIKGLSNLQILNIENSSFNKLGQQRSLQGLDNLEKLQARHNEFTTFTNGVNALDVSGSGNYRIPDPTQSSLEDLPNLKYLDLAYNNLQDSVHLYKNVALTHLDVSHNNHITGVYDGTITTDAQKQAMIERKGRHLLKYGRVKFNGRKKEYGVNATPAQWTEHYTNLQALRERPFDLRTEDLNDTTGLYHLDLSKNVNLEWIDFSYTNIHNTAAGPTYMCPGWMDKDWVTDIDALSATNSSNSSTHRAYVSWHTFIYLIPCSKLKVIHADHNNLSGFGVRYFPYLDTLTCSYMYGESAMMRDLPSNIGNATDNETLRYGKGNTGTQTKIKKYKSVTWGTNDEGETTGTVVLEGPNGSTDDESDFYPNKLRYFDISYSSFNEIRFYPGTADNSSLPNLEYIDVSGNPLNCQVHTNSTVSNFNSLDVTYCPNIRTVKAENCSGLPTVRAYNLSKLDTLYLDNDPLLKTVYIQNDPVLNHFTGLSTLTGLETLFAYNNTQFGGIDVSNNTALKNLWVSNINASSIDVSNNTALQKLRVYDNSLTDLDVESNPALTWLDFARNSIKDIDLSTNTALQYFNCSNSKETLNDQSLAANNHNGGEADETKPETVDNKVGNNSLSDLVFPGTAIQDVRANFNDLHCIKTGENGSFTNLTNIEFAHNHINGIDLSTAPNATVISKDNGRTILADCAKFTPHGDFGNVVTVYFFQIDPNETGNGTLLTDRESKDTKNNTRHLGEDGLNLGKITEWTSDAAVLTANASGLKNVTLNPGNMNDYLDPSQVPGTIVVLAEDPEQPGEGKAKYKYSYSNNADKSDNTATFYLNWSSDGTITGINSVIGDSAFDLAGTFGGIVVAGTDGTVVGVYDTAGRLVASETITDGKAVITGLTPGIYVVNGTKVLVK